MNVFRSLLHSCSFSETRNDTKDNHLSSPDWICKILLTSGLVLAAAGSAALAYSLLPFTVSVASTIAGGVLVTAALVRCVLPWALKKSCTTKVIIGEREESFPGPVERIEIKGIGSLDLCQDYDNNLRILSETNSITFANKTLTLETVAPSTKQPIEHKLITQGSANINICRLEGAKFTCISEGSGTITIHDGEIAYQNIHIHGSGNYHAANFSSKSANLFISSSGSATIKVSDLLTANIVSDSTCYFYGDPDIKTIANNGELIHL